VACVGASRDASTTVAEAFAPGHVTGLFAPRLSARDPRGRGSVGAGLVLELGVHATARWTPGAPDRVVVRSTPETPVTISREAAVRTKGGRIGRLSVSLAHALPVGQGFGMSAAGALATARATAAAIGHIDRPAEEIAHLADLFGGGGLGGVAAIGGGGLEIRDRPGVPPWGSVRRFLFPYPVFLAVLGAPIPSPDLLRDPGFLERVDRAAEVGLAQLGATPSPESFLAASESFTDGLGLAPPAMQRQVERLRRSGASVAQAMFGQAVFAVARDRTTREGLIRALVRERLAAVVVAVPAPRPATL
jgi:pantoate kinase